MMNDENNPISSGGVYDFTDDSISPVSNEAPEVQNVPPSPKPASPAKPPIPPEADLLDKNIGTFETTPFAPVKNVVQPVAQPVIGHKTFVPPANLPIGSATTLVPRKPSPIPIQDIPAQIVKTPVKDLQAAMSPITPEVPTPTTQQDESLKEIAKPLRTYEGDVAEAMSHNRTSKASIAIAESKRREGTDTLANEAPTYAGRKIFMVLISLLLLGGGVVGAYYLYSISPLAPVAQITPQQASSSIVPSDTQSAVTIDPQNPLTTIAKIRSEISKNQAPGTIREIVPVTKDEAGKLFRVTGPRMQETLDINAPDMLTRSIANSWMLGVYADADNNKSTFVVVTSSFFQNTFAGMLQWENIIADDIRQYLYPMGPEGISNESTEGDVGAFRYIDPLYNIDGILPSTASSSAATSTVKIATSTPKTSNVSATSTASTTHRM